MNAMQTEGFMMKLQEYGRWQLVLMAVVIAAARVETKNRYMT